MFYRGHSDHTPKNAQCSPQFHISGENTACEVNKSYTLIKINAKINSAYCLKR